MSNSINDCHSTEDFGFQAHKRVPTLQTRLVRKVNCCLSKRKIFNTLGRVFAGLAVAAAITAVVTVSVGLPVVAVVVGIAALAFGGVAAGMFYKHRSQDKAKDKQDQTEAKEDTETHAESEMTEVSGLDHESTEFDVTDAGTDPHPAPIPGPAPAPAPVPGFDLGPFDNNGEELSEGFYYNPEDFEDVIPGHVDNDSTVEDHTGVDEIDAEEDSVFSDDAPEEPQAQAGEDLFAALVEEFALQDQAPAELFVDDFEFPAVREGRDDLIEGNTVQVRRMLEYYEDWIEEIAGEDEFQMDLLKTYVLKKIAEFIPVYEENFVERLSSPMTYFRQYLTAPFLDQVLKSEENAERIREELRALKPQMNKSPGEFEVETRGESYFGRMKSQIRFFEQIIEGIRDEGLEGGDDVLFFVLEKMRQLANAQQLQYLRNGLIDIDLGVATEIMRDWDIIGRNVQMNTGLLTDQKIEKIVSRAHEIDNDPAIGLIPEVLREEMMQEEDSLNSLEDLFAATQSFDREATFEILTQVDQKEKLRLGEVYQIPESDLEEVFLRWGVDLFEYYRHRKNYETMFELLEKNLVSGAEGDDWYLEIKQLLERQNFLNLLKLAGVAADKRQEAVESVQTIQNVKSRLETDMKSALANQHYEVEHEHRGGTLEQNRFLFRAQKLGFYHAIKSNMNTRYDLLRAIMGDQGQDQGLDLKALLDMCVPMGLTDISGVKDEMSQAVRANVVPMAVAWIGEFERNLKTQFQALMANSDEFLTEKDAQNLVNLFAAEILNGETVPAARLRANGDLDEAHQAPDQEAEDILPFVVPQVGRDWQETVVGQVTLESAEAAFQTLPQDGVYKLYVGNHVFMMYFDEENEQSLIVDPFLGSFVFEKEDGEDYEAVIGKAIGCFTTLIPWAYPGSEIISVDHLTRHGEKPEFEEESDDDLFGMSMSTGDDDEDESSTVRDDEDAAAAIADLQAQFQRDMDLDINPSTSEDDDPRTPVFIDDAEVANLQAQFQRALDLVAEDHDEEAPDVAAAAPVDQLSSIDEEESVESTVSFDNLPESYQQLGETQKAFVDRFRELASVHQTDGAAFKTVPCMSFPREINPDKNKDDFMVALEWLLDEGVIFSYAGGKGGYIDNLWIQIQESDARPEEGIDPEFDWKVRG